MEPFKNLINADVIEATAQHLGRVWPAFPRARFRQQALEGLEGLELKQRVMQLRDALATTLPADFPQACDIIEAALAPAGDSARVGDMVRTGEGLAGWAIWPLTEYVALCGLGQPERALLALHALTQRSSSEFALRPFLLQHPRLTLATLKRWSRDPSLHVRRLVSEGSRPRLPWGLRLHNVVADPSLTLPLLDVLCNDDSDYVRKSVANHLNDISRDHPDLAVATAQKWLDKKRPATQQLRVQKLVQHGLRTLIKQGHTGALACAGFDHAAELSVQVAVLKRKTVRSGEALAFSVTLHNPQATPARVSLDYAVHFLRANGTHSAKIFKWRKLTLAPGERQTLNSQHAFVPVTTRAHYAGEHWLDVRVNGIAHGAQRFVLKSS